MSKQIQNFYKSTLSLDWSIGTGTFYVTTKPTIADGWLVISPNNATVREIIKYTSTGTDSNGDFVVVSERGVGGTTQQTHTVGEPIRMNVTAEYWKDMNDAIDSIVAAGAPNAATDTKGLVEIATDAEVIAGTNTGGTGALLVATPGQIKINYEKIVPIFKTEFIPVLKGDTNSRFDITNPAGTTFRYTWDGTGTDPVINTTTVPINSKISIYGFAFNAGNIGVFTVTGSGTNYFEVTNVAGVAENDKELNRGWLFVLQKQLTWIKPAGLKYIEVELCGGGGAGGAGSSSRSGGSGGAAGGYSFKRILAAALGSTETVSVGFGTFSVTSSGATAGTSSFGSHISATGGVGGIDSGDTTAGGAGTGGDININGESGQKCPSGFFSSSSTSNRASGKGGSSILGFGGTSVWISGAGLVGTGYGSGGSGAGVTGEYGGIGMPGIVKITEFY